MQNISREEYEAMTDEQAIAWSEEMQKPYIAVNGHKMQMYPQFAGGRPIYSSAWTSCTDDCKACESGEPLMDW